MGRTRDSVRRWAPTKFSQTVKGGLRTFSTCCKNYSFICLQLQFQVQSVLEQRYQLHECDAQRVHRKCILMTTPNECRSVLEYWSDIDVSPFWVGNGRASIKSVRFSFSLSNFSLLLPCSLHCRLHFLSSLCSTQSHTSPVGLCHLPHIIPGTPCLL